MSNLYNQKLEILRTLGWDLANKGLLPTEIKGAWERLAIVVEPPKEASHGDMASNLALLLAKPLSMKPIDIAKIFAEGLSNHPSFQSVEVAGPGFLNWRLPQQEWVDLVPIILTQGADYGNSQMGKNAKVNIEYVSTNPTGPLHVGHARGAIVGDALSSLLQKAGFDVTREYYINDAGAQIDKLAGSVYLRYLECLGTVIDLEGIAYPGDYLIPLGQALAEQYKDGLKSLDEGARLELVRKFSVAAMMDLVRSDLAKLGVHQDVFTSELDLVNSGKVDAMQKVLADQDLLYDGVLEPPKGKPTPDDWEPREQRLFKSTKFGDDCDRPIKKSDGSWTYFASDIAYHYDKYMRGFNHQINVWGADHSGYIKRVQAALNAVSKGQASLNVKICQIVKFVEDGKPLRMSKRSGNFVALEDLIAAVGKDVVRFYMLMRKNDAPLEFDLALVTDQSRENPVFYVQYAHARCNSVLKQAGELFGEDTINVDRLIAAKRTSLVSKEELDLLKILGQWPRLIVAAAEAEEPHRIIYYLLELAGAFHALWTRGKENTTLRFIQEADLDATYDRLSLIWAVKSVLANGLNLVQIQAMDAL